MKRRLSLITVALAAIITVTPLLVSGYPQPLLEYKFNVNDGNNSTNTGYYPAHTLYMFGHPGASVPTNWHTASGLGVSGATGDQAFNNGARDMGNVSPNGGFADQRAAYTEYESRNALTIALWFNAYTQMLRNAGLVTKLAGNYGWSLDVNTGTTPQPMRLILGSGSGQLITYATANGTATGANLYPETGSWVFCAVTWDGTLSANNVIWYKGTKTSSVVPVYTGQLVLSQIAQGGAFLTVGSMNGTQTNRSFYGLLDNVRVWMSSGTNTAVIGQDGLEVYRQLDIIPEPGVVVGAGVLVLAALRRRG